MRITTSTLALALSAVSLAFAESYIEWGGARPTAEFDLDVMATYQAAGVEYSAVLFSDLSVAQRKEWHPVAEGSKNLNEATAYFDAACENTPAFKTMKDAEAKCGKSCPNDFFLIENWGVYAGMDFVKDGIMFMSCAVTTGPKSCLKGACEKKDFKLLLADDVPQAVKYMNSLGDHPMLITAGTNSTHKMKSRLAKWAKQNGKSISLPKP